MPRPTLLLSRASCSPAVPACVVQAANAQAAGAACAERERTSFHRLAELQLLASRGSLHNAWEGGAQLLLFCLLVYLCCFFCASTKLPLGFSPFLGKHILPTRLMPVGPFRLAHQPGLNAVHTCSSEFLLAQASSEEYWWREVAAATPRWMRLRNECKRAGIEVVYTVYTYLRPFYRDS